MPSPPATAWEPARAAAAAAMAESPAATTAPARAAAAAAAAPAAAPLRLQQQHQLYWRHGCEREARWRVLPRVPLLSQCPKRDLEDKLDTEGEAARDKQQLQHAAEMSAVLLVHRYERERDARQKQKSAAVKRVRKYSKLYTGAAPAARMHLRELTCIEQTCLQRVRQEAAAQYGKLTEDWQALCARVAPDFVELGQSPHELRGRKMLPVIRDEESQFVQRAVEHRCQREAARKQQRGLQAAAAAAGALSAR
ncbi:hypothetical protein JKP88DRAFT_281493 [Tribonema minus]|uniref:Uncharacterized protein n=1 Tax=Tribonema minus TaxID=303371 RepID=A0A835YQ57_9STRA|nr:hypothetical protein JKP88DRAFT_281493 [Tribonema minus]